MWYTLDTRVCNRLAWMYVHVHAPTQKHTHTHLHAHQPVSSSCQQASCLPVSPSVHGLESPLTTHTHTHSHFHQAGSWCLVASSLSGCLAGEILESQLQTRKDVNRIMKKVDFQVMVIARQTFWLCWSILHEETVSSSTAHTWISTKLFSKMLLDSLPHTHTHTHTHKHTHMAVVVPRGGQFLQCESDLLASLSVGMTFPPK